MINTTLINGLQMKQLGDMWIAELSRWEMVYSKFIPLMYSLRYEELAWYFVGEVPTDTGFSTTGRLLRQGAWVDRERRELVTYHDGMVALWVCDSNEALETEILKLKNRSRFD